MKKWYDTGTNGVGVGCYWSVISVQTINFTNQDKYNFKADF